MTWEVSDSELAAWRRAHPDATATEEELSLAIACAQGRPSALAEFDARFRDVVATAVRRLGDDDFGQEVAQLVRQRLLVGEGASSPRITEFGGRGSLSKFVQAVALRTALNLRTARARHVGHEDPDDALLELPAKENDPELELLKLRYRAEFKAAFAAAMAELEPELRAALRHVYLDGLTLAELGRLYDWSVPTASRRVAAARTAVLEGTRRHLAQRLSLAAHEVDSVLRLIESRLSVELTVAD
ncbi:MAG: sigma factor-like helix-turn-helix DNA-binding protein [Myxococcota bacterium]